MILADYHTHTCFSGDSDALPEEQVKAALRAGLQYMCFTDHEDLDYPEGDTPFIFDTEEYFKVMRSLQEQYHSKIALAIGVELGLQPHLINRLPDFAASRPFDYIIGSTHVVDGLDPYYPRYWKEGTEKEQYTRYFECTLKNIRAFDCFDCYGHIDYIVRYGPGKNRNYSYSQYQDILDEILKTLISRGKGIECNTAGFKYGLGHPNPEEGLIRRYVELGGEILTIGSDGHKPEHIAYDFHRLPELLKSCGVRYYTIFRNRKPEFIRL